MAKRKRIPVYIDYDTGTRYIQSPKTGLMKGRKKVKGFGDRTAVKRIRKGFDSRGGEIIGRTSPISRTVLVKQHKRRSKKGKKHSVNSYLRT